MTGPAPDLSPYMTKTSTSSAKTAVEALMKGSPSVSQPTRPLPEAPETPATPYDFGQMPREQQIIHAAHVLVTLRTEPAPAALWSLADRPHGVYLEGSVHPTVPTKGVDQRAAMAQWAELLDHSQASESTSITDAVHLLVEGERLSVPVRMYSVLRAPAGGES